MEHLRDLPRLKLLTIQAQVNDAGMHHLRALVSLEKLTCRTRPELARHLNDTGVIEVIETPLADVIRYLADYYKAPFRIDTAALAAAGLNAETITITAAHSGSLRDLLDAVLLPHQLDWTTDADGFVITSARAAEHGRQGVRALQESLPNLKQIEIDW